jgi:internalin A
VLLIQSRCESRRDERDPPCLPSRDEFPNLSTLTFSARTGRHKDSLTETLQEAIADLFGRRKQPLIGVGRVAVRERIRAAQAMPEGERIRTLTRDEFRRWCDETGGVSDADALLQFLHRTGVVFYRPGLFGDRVILDQAWALEAIYAVFHRRTDLQRELNLRRGRFTRELLDRFLWGAIRRDEGKEPYTPAEQELFLGMMTQCHIAFQVRDEDHGEAGREFAAPELLPEWTNWNDLHFRHLLRRPADDAVVLRYDFLHDGIARRFLAQVGARARQQAVYWKYGCGFYDARTETDVIVRCEPAPTADRPGAGAISLGTWGPGARELLLTLTEVLMRMPIGQPPRLEPADFLDRSAQQGMRSDAGNPMARVEPAVRPRTVFVSYAHGPVTSDLVRRLAARLGTAGTTVVWDAECLREGESISAFIDSVRTVPVLIAVFDSRYPRSAYCASELFAFYESCGSLPVAFAERVVPLVLGDARIDTDLDRKDHGIFWADEAARRSPAAATGSLDDHAYRTFQHMHTWARQIANRLADLTNRLSSLRGEGIAVDDFQNVVDRLEAVYLRLGM